MSVVIHVACWERNYVMGLTHTLQRFSICMVLHQMEGRNNFPPSWMAVMFTKPEIQHLNEAVMIRFIVCEYFIK